MLDTETYNSLVKRLHPMEEVSAVRAMIQKAQNAGPRQEVPEVDIERSQMVVRELMAETERLGLYR